LNKKVTRLFSLAVVVLMVLSLAAVNVCAASTPHTVTITPSATTGKAGDTITFSINIDNTLKMNGLSYKFKYDPNVFSIDTTMVGQIGKKYANYNDGTWYLAAKNGEIYLFAYTGAPEINADTVNGTIALSCASSNGVDAEGVETNALIGKFKLTVINGAAAGNTSLTLIETETSDMGEGFGAAMTVAPVTFTVEGAAPTTYTVTYDANTGTGTVPTQEALADKATFTVKSASGLTAPSGKQFKEWNTQADGLGTAYAVDSTFTMGAANVILYAIWEDIPVTDTIITASIASTNEGKGIVEVNGTRLANGGSINLGSDTTATIVILPALGSEVSSATLTGVTSMGIDKDGGKFEASDLSGNVTLTVSFAGSRTETAKPQLCGKFFKETGLTHGDKTGLTGITTFAKKPSTGTISECGVKLVNKATNSDVVIGTTGPHFPFTATATESGQYGVQFIGLPAGTYISTPYAIVDGVYQYGTAVELILN